MSRWGPPVRTQADKMRDVELFLARARPEKVAAATAEDLARMHGVKDVQAVKYKLTMAQARLAG